MGFCSGVYSLEAPPSWRPWWWSVSFGLAGRLGLAGVSFGLAGRLGLAGGEMFILAGRRGLAGGEKCVRGPVNGETLVCCSMADTHCRCWVGRLWSRTAAKDCRL